MGDITQAMQQQYADNFIIQSQQKKSRLEAAATVYSGIIGSSKSVDRIAAVAAIKRTTRHGDTPIVETPYSKRWIDLADYELADLIDDQDKIKTITDPTSAVLMNILSALGRAKDDVIIAALQGNARSNDAGNVALPAGQKIAHGGTAMTLAKLLQAREILLASESFDEEDPSDGLFIALGSGQLIDLLNTTEVKSADYNSVKALVNGQIDTFLGFKFIRSERLPLATYRYCYAWAKSGMALGIGAEITGRIDERADKSYAMQAYGKMSLGAVRTEEEKVVEIACTA